VGIHPIGVSNVFQATPGCNEIDGTGRRVWASMFRVPSESGGPVSFSWLNTPSAGPRPQFAVGYTVISTSVAVPGIRVPGMALGCDFHVPLDVLIPVLVPLRPGCHVALVGMLPPIPGLRGFRFYAQTWARDLTVNRDLVTNTIEITVQP
jgi:hypothetical protein